MLRVECGHATDVGRVRRHNEDALLAGGRVWAIADGMGGHAAGDVASALVIETLRQLDAGPDEIRPADLVAAVHAAHAAIVGHGRAYPESRGLGSTVTGLALVTVGGAEHWAVFNVGDSRVYRDAGTGLRRATVDHSETEELVIAGVITEAQARTHRARNVITRSLGQPDVPQVDLWVLPRTAGERFVVCSDGLTGELDDAAVADLLLTHPDAQAAATALVEAAVRHAGRDNVSVIVVNVEGTPDAVDEGTNPRVRAQ